MPKAFVFLFGETAQVPCAKIRPVSGRAGRPNLAGQNTVIPNG